MASRFFCPPAYNSDLQSTSDCTLTELDWQKWSRRNNKWLETQNFTWTVFLDLFIAITACNFIPICSSIPWLIAHLKGTKRVTWGVRRGKVRGRTVSRRLFDYFSLHIDGYISLSAFEYTIKWAINVSLPSSCYWIAPCYFSYFL